MENNNRLQMDGIQNEKNTKWSKIKQIMLKELMNFVTVIVILAVILVIVNIAFPNLKNRAILTFQTHSIVRVKMIITHSGPVV